LASPSTSLVLRLISLHSPPITRRFTTQFSPLQNAWFSELFRTHDLKPLDEITGNNQAYWKHLICFNFILLSDYIREHGIYTKTSNLRLVLKSFEAG